MGFPRYSRKNPLFTATFDDCVQHTSPFCGKKIGNVGYLATLVKGYMGSTHAQQAQFVHRHASPIICHDLAPRGTLDLANHTIKASLLIQSGVCFCSARRRSSVKPSVSRGPRGMSSVSCGQMGSSCWNDNESS